ncbi:MAG: Stk1 family PASTA domain-containing Ser/Thr kinase [Clostridiaceae bacterium]|nr:Stk1 family PASTA domain-containing Ser/Thr kinase [Clostridiaceae bacterium]
MVGKVLGNRYELIEKIGGGGMALVYKAKCGLLNRFVAVKILRPEFTNDEEFVMRFRVEAQAAASLSHPNIVSIYDVGHEGDIHYIVMEYVNGITLKEYIDQKGPLDWKEVVNISIQICLAIENAHKNHIVHRDIKPHNILFTGEGIAKVADFGIARAVTSSTITMAGSTIGSVHYFSPEQARGGFTDEKSDLYSIGIVMYELLTGQVPFNGESPVAVALKHLQDEPSEPIELRADIPKGLNDIIMKAIQKDQVKRYQTVTELLGLLYRILKEPDVVFSSNENNDVESSPTIRMPSLGDKRFKEGSNPIQKAGEEKMKKKKNEKLTTILAVSTSFIIIVIVGIMLFKFGPDIAGNPKDFIVEDYKGQNFYEVKGMLAKEKITAKEVRKKDDEYPKDTIISQDKAENEKLKPGAEGYNTIEFVVSDGPQMVRITDLRGMDYRMAETKLRNQGLNPETLDEHSETVTAGYVIKTEPDINYDVRPGSTVKIFKSIGPEIKKVVVPDLKGLTKTEAYNRLSYAGLAAGKTFPEEMTSYVIDKIANQNPAAGIEVDEGTMVDIYLQDNNPDQRRVNKRIELDNPDSFGDNIKVLVTMTRSDTNRVETILNSVKKKSDFPLIVGILVPNGGNTVVKIYLNEELYKDFTEYF